MNDFLHAPIGAAELVETLQRWLTADGGLTPRTPTSPSASAAIRIASTTGPVLDIAKALGRLGGNRTPSMNYRYCSTMPTISTQQV